jgi:uncharacterized protein (DUF58 family)
MTAMLRLLRRIPAWFGSLPTTTLAGRVILTATGVFAIVALASGRNGPLLVLSVLLAILAVSTWASGRNLRRIELSREIPSRVRAGEEFTVRLRIRNRRRFSPAIALRIRDALHPVAVVSGTIPVPHVPPGGDVLVSFRARIRRRGAYRITNAMLVTRFPFGLLERRALRRHPSEILVTPREAPCEVDLEPGRGARHQEAGVRGARRAGTEEFLGIREYRPGDNPHWIAWKASARQGCLMVRELDRPRRRRVVLLLDTDTGSLPSWARGPAIERGVSLVAGIAGRLRRRRRAGIFAALEPRPIVLRGLETMAGHRALLDALALLRPAPGRLARDLLSSLDPEILRGATVVLVAMRPGAGTVEMGARVRAAGGWLRVVDASPGRRPRIERGSRDRPGR